MKRFAILFFVCLFGTLAHQSYAQEDKITMQALMYWDKIIHDSPANAQAFASRGMMYFAMEQYENALKDFDKALSISSEHADWHYFRALARENSGQYEASLTDYNKAIQLYGAKANMFHFMHRGYVYYNLGKYKEALTDINKAIAMSPNNQDLVNLKVDIEGALQANKPEPAAKKISNPNDPQSDPSGYIATHHFTSFEEGKSYFDRLEHLGVSPQELSDLKKQLRYKVIRDMFGEDPDNDQLRELSTVLENEKWLLPEGNERYERYLKESSTLFTGREDVGNIIYTYTVEKDPRSNKYNIDIRKLENEQLNLAYSSIVSTHPGAVATDMVVNMYYAENFSYQWRIFPNDYLEVQYTKDSPKINFAVVGARLVAKTGRLPEGMSPEDIHKKIEHAGFTEKAAIKHALRVWILQYGKMVGRE